MDSNNIVLEKQQKRKTPKNSFMSDWGVPVFEACIGSLGILVSLTVTLIALVITWGIGKLLKS